jgi:hypothetical protein
MNALTVERVHHSGAVIVSATVRGYLVTRIYYGYTQRESVRLFREALA